MSTFALLPVVCLAATVAVAAGQVHHDQFTHLGFQHPSDDRTSHTAAAGLGAWQRPNAALARDTWAPNGKPPAARPAAVDSTSATSAQLSTVYRPIRASAESTVVRDRPQHASIAATAAVSSGGSSDHMHWLLQSPRSSIARILQQLLGPTSGSGSQQMQSGDSSSQFAGASSDDMIKQPTMNPTAMLDDETDSSSTVSGNTAASLAAAAASNAAVGGEPISLTQYVLQNALPVAAAQGAGPSDGSSSNSIPMSGPNPQQQQQQQQPTGSSSSNLNDTYIIPFPALPRTNGSSGSASPLKTLLQGMALSWQQRRSLGTCPLAAAGNLDGSSSSDGSNCREVLEVTWQQAMQKMEQQQPELAAFARLAGQHPLLLQMVSSTGLPAVLLAPSNTAVEAMLKKQQEEAATMTNDTAASSRLNGTWQQWVADAQQAPAESLLFLLRHIIPARQPQLLDSSGAVSRQLLGRVMAGDLEDGNQQQPGNQQDDLLVFNSLVVQTALGSYVQVSELPDAPSAYRLELAAAAAVVASNRNASILRPSAQNLGPYPLTQQQLLLARRNVSWDPDDNSTAAGISHLHIGAHLRALEQPYQLNITRMMVIGLNGVLKESDEVVNGGTAAQLRGAFGWSPEDEQSLLSRIYLDPESTYWARTLRVSGNTDIQRGNFGMSRGPDGPGGQGATMQGSTMPGTTVPGSTMPGQQPVNSASGATAAAMPAQSQQNPPSGSSGSSGGFSSGSGGNRGGGGGGRKLKQQQQQQQQQSNTGASNWQPSTGSSSSSSPQVHSVSTSPMPSSPPPGPTTNAQASQSSTMNIARQTSGNSSTAAPVAAPPGSRASMASNPNAAAAAAALGRPSPPLLSPSAIAELIARQQQQSMEMRMADALAANLMIIEALSAWTVAAVTQPAAVFAPLNVQDLRFRDGNLDQDELSGDVSVGNQCLVDWGSPCGMPWGCIKTGSSNSTCTRCCYLSPATANISLSSTIDPYRLPANSSSMNNICPLNAAAAAAAVGSSSSISPGRCSGWQYQEQSGMLLPAPLVGLSPYQLYPSLGLLDAAYDMRFSASSKAGEANSSSQAIQQPAAAAAAASNTSSPAVQATASEGQNSSSSSNARGLKQADISGAEPGVNAPPPWRPLTAAAREQQPSAAAAAAPAAPQAAAAAVPAAPTAAAGAAAPAATAAAATPTAAAAAPTAAAGAATPAAPPAAAAAAGAVPTQGTPANPPTNTTAAAVAQAAAAAAAATGNRPPPPLYQKLGNSSNGNASESTTTTTTTTSSSSTSPASAPASQQSALPSVSPPLAAPSSSDPQVAAAPGGAASAAEPPPAAAAAAAAAAATAVGDGEGIWVRVPTDQLSFLTVLELAGLLAEGRVTPQQLTELFSGRLRRYNDLLHAAVTYTDDLAAQQSAVASQALRDNNVTRHPLAPPVRPVPPPPPSRGLLQTNADAAAAAAAAASNASSNAPPNTATAASSSPANSLAVQPDSQASSQAYQASDQVLKSSRMSLLTGIPYGLKDLFAVPGYPTAWGLTALQNRTINTPSWPFSSLSGASGAVLLAKTATGELAWGDVYFDEITTRNPWNVNTGSCGSSAGSAVAVAAGLLPFAVGSETWGSIVCPATTVGVTAYRPTGGSIPSHGMMQVSSTLDKTGIFCRQALDCAVVADALMDKGFSGSSSSIVNTSTTLNAGRLHRQNAQLASTFNYSAFQESQQALPAAQRQQYNWKPLGSSFVLPPTFQQLPPISATCIGFLEGASEHVLDAISSLNPKCIKGPLPPPGNNNMVRDILSVILQVDVSVSLEGLWLEGYISQKNHWYPLIQLGQVSPAAAYVKAQRLRSVLLSQVKAYYAAYGIQVLLKPAKSDVGTDGLATLLDMPELLLPVGFTVAAQSASESADSSQQQMGSKAEQVWLQPDVNSLVALPGHDAHVVAVGAAFQSVTAHHLVHPSLPAV